MLERFIESKAKEIEELRKLKAEGDLAEALGIDLSKTPALPPGVTGPTRPAFAATLRARGRGAIIAEYKRASPSRGDINLALGPAEVAALYAASGASAISVLTEETYFKGSLEFLDIVAAVGLPMLRKDFIIDPVQIERTALTPASAILLIARMCDNACNLGLLHDLALEYGLEPVVEVFNERDLANAKNVGARIIQVNNRDLQRLTTDLDISRMLAPFKREGELWISASGLERPEEVREMADLGFDAVLIGTSIMKSADPGALLRALSGKESR